MPATIIGSTKGTFSVDQVITGLVIETIDYDYQTENVPFPDRYSQTTAVAYLNESTNISIKAYTLAGTSFTGTLASSLTLSAMPAFLKAGNTGGTSIIENIKISDAAKDWRKLDMTVVYYPNVV